MDVVVVIITAIGTLVGFGIGAYLRRKKLKPLPRPNRVPYDSKTFRK